MIKDITFEDLGYSTFESAAKEVGVHANTLRNWVKYGWLDCYRVSKFHILSHEQIEQAKEIEKIRVCLKTKVRSQDIQKVVNKELERLNREKRESKKE